MSRFVVHKGDEISDSGAWMALHTLCLPSDDLPSHPDAFWIVRDDALDQDCGFATVKLVDGGKVAFMQRSGVLRYARGNKLQRRLLQQRERWLRDIGVGTAITYTAYDNHASIFTLLKAGYKFYWPAWNWAGKHVHYYTKGL